MTDFWALAKTRRSIRKFTADPVADEKLEALLEAGRWAPSWANTQCTEVVVVRDPAVKAKLQEAVPPGNPAHAAIVDAPVILALCAKRQLSGYYKGEAPTKHGDWYMFDAGLVAQNVALAAQDEGLGTVVVGLMDQGKAEAILNTPEGIEVVALMPIGVPAAEAKAPPRKEMDAFVHQEGF